MQTTVHTLRKAAKSLHQGGHWGNPWSNPALYVRLWWHGLLNFRSVYRLQNDTYAGMASQRLADEPHFLGVLVWPLVDLRWTAQRRLQEMMAHYREATCLGSMLDLRLSEVRSLLKLDSLCDTLDVCVERQPWFSREGQAALSLFYAGERVHSVVFLLSRKDNRRIAHIGAVQGVKQADDSDTFKHLTKAAHGLRPRDLNLALFLLLCEAMQVERVVPVPDRYRQHRHSYFGKSKETEVFVNYDDVWAENGATVGEDGVLTLAPGIHTKDLAEVPSKKRSMYRKRAAFLEESLQAFKESLQACLLSRGCHGRANGVARHAKAEQLQSKVYQHCGKLMTVARPSFLGTWLWSFPTIF